MTLTAFLSHLFFAICLLVVSLILTHLMLHRVRVMDVPNERSSHHMPIPKSGGIAIVATFLIGAIVIFFVADKTLIRRDYILGFVISALLIAGISFYDDVKNKPFIVKLITQLFAVFLVLAFGLVIDQISLPFLGSVTLGVWAYPISFLWIIGMTNAFNFMDGLDGLAGGIAVIVSAFFCAITFSQGSIFVYITCYALLAGSLGFLIYNFPPAKVFMGDVGSAFLGFVFAVLAIIAARYDHSHTSFMVMPLLLFNVIYDTFFTFIRRSLRGDRVLDAHRTHLYQLFNRLGYSHRTVSLFHYCVCIIQGLAAVWMVNIPGDNRVFVFVPFLILQILYSFVIINSAKKSGIFVMQAPKLILGLRELSRPRGEGYLYYKRSLKEDDKILLFLDLYNTTEAELEGLFRQAVTSIIKKENLSGNDVQGFLSSYSTENMRQWTQEVLARVVSLFMDPEYQRGSRIT